jgi:hypothetical protein
LLLISFICKQILHSLGEGAQKRCFRKIFHPVKYNVHVTVAVTARGVRSSRAIGGGVAALDGGDAGGAL